MFAAGEQDTLERLTGQHHPGIADASKRQARAASLSWPIVRHRLRQPGARPDASLLHSRAVPSVRLLVSRPRSAGRERIHSPRAAQSVSGTNTGSTY